MNTATSPTELAAVPGSPPEWLEDILEAINWTDGVDECRWGTNKDGIITVAIDYGEETLTFRAGSDGDCHGVQYDGSIHDMTDAEQVQWWCAGELYTRLQKAKRRIADLEANKVITNSHEN